MQRQSQHTFHVARHIRREGADVLTGCERGRGIRGGGIFEHRIQKPEAICN